MSPVVELWDRPGAPVLLRREIEDAQAEYFDAIGKLGISREAYVLAAREAIKEARRFFDDKKIRSRNTKLPEGADSKATGLARWSTILGSFQRLLHDYARTGWALCWGSIRTIARTFGTDVRAAWERLRMLRDATLVRAWSRWKDELHEYDEGRSNIYLLMVPPEIFAWWVTLPKAQSFLASLRGAGGASATPSAQAAAVAAPPPAPPLPPRKTRASQPPAAPAAAFFPALFHGLRGADERYRGEDERTGGGTMKAENAIECEQVLQQEAERAREHCEKHGLPLPDVAALAHELGRAVVLTWLKERGDKDAVVDKRHVFGLIHSDVRRLAVAARARWTRRQGRPQESAAAAPPRDKPRFTTPPPAAVLAAAAPSGAVVDEARPIAAHPTAASSGPRPGVVLPAVPDKPPD